MSSLADIVASGLNSRLPVGPFHARSCFGPGTYSQEAVPPRAPESGGSNGCHPSSDPLSESAFGKNRGFGFRPLLNVADDFDRRPPGRRLDTGCKGDGDDDSESDEMSETTSHQDTSAIKS